MNEREFFQARRKTEKDAFLRVIRALPEGKLDYKPHERSPTAAQLLTTLIYEHATCGDVVQTGRGEWKSSPVSSVQEAAAAFETHWDELDRRVAGLDDAGWQKKAQFFSGGKMVMETPIGEFLWMILFDAIHHRGQLTTYIRPMGGKVPAVYGPSGDSRS
jgi:uncharacterized damage-inducible protein DinB